MVELNLFKAQFVANSFSLIFAAGRSCLLPFLSYYLRYIGLTATQTGVLFGIRAFTSAWTSICWTCCTTTSRRRRVVLVISLLVLVAMHSIMTLMPTVQNPSLKFCHSPIKNNSMEPECAGGTSDIPGCANVFKNSTRSAVSSNKSSVLNKIEGKTNVGTATELSQINWSIGVTTFILDETVSTAEIAKPGSLQQPSSVMAPSTEIYQHIPLHKRHRKDLSIPIIGKSLEEKGDESDDAVDSSTVFPIREVNIGSGNEDLDHAKELEQRLDAIQEQIFGTMIVLIFVGEVLSSPTERIADELWLGYLDSADMLEKSGTPRRWALLGAALMPWAITLLVDRLPCTLPIIHVHRIFVHFYVFFPVIGLTVIFALLYPTPSNDEIKSKKWSRLLRGLRTICADVSCFLYAFTILVLGVIYGFIGTFLLWAMQESSIDGSELPMGVALTTAAVGEFVVAFFAVWIVRKLGHPTSIAASLLILTSRCLLYSFLPGPWFAIIGESLHCLSHTTIWTTIHNIHPFRINPLVMDGSAVSALSAIYQGFGIATGCIFAGFTYSWGGASTAFQLAAGLSAAWCLVFCLVYRFVVKKHTSKARYSRVVQDDGVNARDDDSATSDLSEDDWLDVALKHQR